MAVIAFQLLNVGHIFLTPSTDHVILLIVVVVIVALQCFMILKQHSRMMTTKTTTVDDAQAAEKYHEHDGASSQELLDSDSIQNYPHTNLLSNVQGSKDDACLPPAPIETKADNYTVQFCKCSDRAALSHLFQSKCPIQFPSFLVPYLDVKKVVVTHSLLSSINITGSVIQGDTEKQYPMDLLQDADPADVNDRHCAICWRPYTCQDVIAFSKNPSCCHNYHLQCILPWLLKKFDCPMCRCDFVHSTSLTSMERKKLLVLCYTAKSSS